MEKDSEIGLEEVVRLMRDVITGEKIAKKVVDDRYSWNNEGPIFKCTIENYKISFFIDAGELDYIEEISTTSRRYNELYPWTNDPKGLDDPLEELSEDEIEKLSIIFAKL